MDPGEGVLGARLCYLAVDEARQGWMKIRALFSLYTSICRSGQMT